jgi:hypothetical protein
MNTPKRLTRYPHIDFSFHMFDIPESAHIQFSTCMLQIKYLQSGNLVAKVNQAVQKLKPSVKEI